METRTCTIIMNFGHIKDKAKWKDLKTIVKIESTRDSKAPISTIDSHALLYFKLGRQTGRFSKSRPIPLGIENKLHGTLDVAFSEDAFKKRSGNAAQNFSLINK